MDMRHETIQCFDTKCLRQEHSKIKRERERERERERGDTINGASVEEDFNCG